MNLRRLGSAAALIAALGLALAPVQASATLVQVDPSQNTVKLDGTTNTVKATVADGANITLGAQADAACATDIATCTLQALIKRELQKLTTLNTTLGAPIQATGGTVGLVAGTATVGKVGFDQTTPGTTNGVQVNAALPAGTNNIGKISGAGTVGTPDVNVVTIQGTTANGSSGNPAPVLLGMRSSTGGSTGTVDQMANTMNLGGSTVIASGVVGSCDDTAQTLLTENNFGAVRMSCSNHALVERPYETAENSWSFAAAASGIVNTTTAVTVHAAAGAGLRNYLLACHLSHDTLSAVTEFVIRDGASGTVISRNKLQTTANENIPISFAASPLRGTANTLMEAATLTAVTGGVYLNCQGFVAP